MRAEIRSEPLTAQRPEPDHFIPDKQKPPQWKSLKRLETCQSRQEVRLLDLGFLEVDMLADNRIVLFQDEFFGHRAGIFLGHIEVTRASRGVQADLDSCWLRHGSIVPIIRARQALCLRESARTYARTGLCQLSLAVLGRRLSRNIIKLPERRPRTSIKPGGPIRSMAPPARGGAMREPVP